MSAGGGGEGRMETSDRICAALDFPTWERAAPFARAIAPAVGMLKVGLELFTAEGPAVVREAAALGLQAAQILRRR